jgi:hypothetical protein
MKEVAYLPMRLYLCQGRYLKVSSIVHQQLTLSSVFMTMDNIITESYDSRYVLQLYEDWALQLPSVRFWIKMMLASAFY